MKHRPVALSGLILCLGLLSFAINPLIASAQKMMYSGSRADVSGQSSAPSQSSVVAASHLPVPVRRPDTMSSIWEKGYKSRVRIIAGDTNFSDNNSAFAGVQVQMEPGWKTYWRSPGEAGVPPSFDWSGSKNLKKLTIQWPAPKTYKDEYSTSIGYKHEVILPIKIVARDKRKPVQVKLRFAYGICDDICVPVEAKLKLTIPTLRSGHRTLLSRYRKMVPQSVKSTGKSVNGFSFRKVSINLKGEKPRITIDARVPANTKKAELYVEAPNGFYLPLPVGERPSAGNHRRFHIDLTKSDPPKGLTGKTLALTLVGDHSGIEYKYKIN